MTSTVRTARPIQSESFPDLGRLMVAAEVPAGEELRLVKYLAYGWSATRSRPALVDQVSGAVAAAELTGWQGLLDEQRAYLDNFWEGADVEVDGDVEIQQAVRFGLFHILQAGARAELRPIPAKGLTGTGYDGHTFWDTEMFVLPVLTYTQPDAAADALRWRHSILPIAKEHAKELGLQGAAFPWRTIHGEECSGYWPAGTAAFHINADIAAAVTRYLDATHDAEFEREIGLPLLVETARLWRSLGQHDAGGKFRIEGVTGPDEYSAIKDNNVYTNLMAQANLAAAADLAAKLMDEARALDVTTEEAAAWRDAAADMYIPYDERLGVHPQHDGFTDYARWDFAATPPDHYPLLLHYPYFQLYRKQVVKQADVVLGHDGARRRLHPSPEAAQLRLLRGRSRSGTHPCPPAPRPSWRPRSATSSSPTTTSPRPPSWTSRTASTTPRTDSTSRPWPAPIPPSSADSAGPAPAPTACRSGRGCRRASRD